MTYAERSEKIHLVFTKGYYRMGKVVVESDTKLMNDKLQPFNVLECDAGMHKTCKQATFQKDTSTNVCNVGLAGTVTGNDAVQKIILRMHV